MTGLKNLLPEADNALVMMDNQCLYLPFYKRGISSAHQLQQKSAALLQFTGMSKNPLLPFPDIHADILRQIQIRNNFV